MRSKNRDISNFMGKDIVNRSVSDINKAINRFVHNYLISSNTFSLGPCKADGITHTLTIKLILNWIGKKCSFNLTAVIIIRDRFPQNPLRDCFYKSGIKIR